MVPSLLAAALMLTTIDSPAVFDAAAAQRFADLALGCVHKEYPGKIAHVLNGDADVQPPRKLTLAHLDGLNLSRAWMLLGMARGLPTSDSRIASLRATAASHREAGLRAVTGAYYEGGHWLGTFAVYLVTAERATIR